MPHVIIKISLIGEENVTDSMIQMPHVIIKVSLIGEENLPDSMIQMLAALCIMINML